MSEFPLPPSPKREVIAPVRKPFANESPDEIQGAEHEYGDARLWLCARDPRCLFAYWNFRPEEHPEAACADGRRRFFLRVFREEMTESTAEIEGGSGSIFIHDRTPDSAYAAELGFFTGEVWCFLVRSVVTRTPPEIPVGDTTALFSTVPGRLRPGNIGDALVRSALTGESLAVTVARIHNEARQLGKFIPEHEPQAIGQFIAAASHPIPRSNATSPSRAWE